MTNSYKIQSVIISPDAWLFTRTTSSVISENLSFTSSQNHGDTRHIVSYECEADTLNEAWQMFFKTVSDFIEAVVFQTSSYLAFHDWNHLIINKTQQVALISVFERTYGTSLGLYFQDDVDDVSRAMEAAKSDPRFKNFLHCYRMAVLVDAPETQDAYEKYLILACEALAGEVDDGNDGTKYNRKRQEQIIGKKLHKYFFSSVDPVAGKTIRNANMHHGKSPNQKPSETLKLVNKLREFVAEEYGLTSLSIIEEKNSPTRGLYRDDGGLILVRGAVGGFSLNDITDLNEFIKEIDENEFKILGGQDFRNAIANI